MFDPTVFDNLKVAIENQIYDLDNLDEIIRIVHREDRLEMAVMSRHFALRFHRTEQPAITAEIRLAASLQDLASEILEQPGQEPSCTLTLQFELKLRELEPYCTQIEHVMQTIWEPVRSPTQSLTFIYGHEPVIYHNRIELQFHRKINENQMEDIPDLIEHMLQTLSEMNRIIA